MESMIWIGGKVEKETAENLAGLVERVFKSGKENGMDQDTICEELGLIKSVIDSNVHSLNGCNLTNKTYNVDIGGEEEE